MKDKSEIYIPPIPGNLEKKEEQESRLLKKLMDAEEKFLVLKEKDQDNVNQPQHYAAFSIEVIDAIESWNLDFRLANVVKYVARAPHKGKQFEDLKKALWYIARFMKTEFPEEYARDHQKIVKSLDLLDKKR